MNKNQNIYMDLDGTILDNTSRHYEVYRSVYLRLDLKYLNFDEWLATSRAGELLLPKEHREEYIDMFQWYFESSLYLQMDKIYPDMVNVIENIDHFCNMHIVTMRADRLAAEKQLRKYIRIDPNITCRYPTGISRTAFVQLKTELILEASDSYPTGCIIGDTEYEILAGKQFGLKTIAVTWGMRDRKTLEQYSPDVIVDRPYDILEAIRSV